MRHRHRRRMHGPSSLRSSQRRVRPGPRSEDQAYRSARWRANLKLSFYTHAVLYGSVLTLILVASRSFRATLIVGLAWGIGLACHYFVALVAPDLRRRLIERELPRRVEEGVGQERHAKSSEHLRSLEDLSASIAHEIRNPITAAKSLVQQMGEDPSAGSNVEYAKVAIEELDRVERSISHLLRFSRDEELRIQEFSLAEIADSAVETFRGRGPDSAVELRCEWDSPARMRGDPEKCRRVVINLVGNAIDALAGTGLSHPCVEIGAGENLAGTETWLRVRDNGPGIAEDRRSKVFSPFHTTKEGGTGLGLALSKRIIEAHGGAIELNSSPESGTEFIVTFPKRVATGGES